MRILVEEELQETAAYRRLMRKLTIENLWLYVLSLLKEGPLYGYEIAKRIEEKFGFKPGRVTCYIVLYKLQSEGLIASAGPGADSEGPQRKYYTLTREGERALDMAKDFLRGLAERL
ncbi:MAG: PadR family transcriptional regulator [Thaumarchaeota archaeon]|jgi:DNA-binding PadR family transcriptional regulator|nr:PadR family transcriptional regulator [Candidatus Wolframiiraptor allenii]MCL7393971.1 PadR family transcriptional regulator [Candidatus Wolframiiraptor allenii]